MSIGISFQSSKKTHKSFHDKGFLMFPVNTAQKMKFSIKDLLIQ